MTHELIKIIVTDDKAGWRKIVREDLLPHNIEVIAEAEHGLDLLKHLETLVPDVILLDLSMPVMDGNKTVYWLNKNYPESKVIIMSFFDYPVLMYDYVLRDVKGCLSKGDGRADVEELVTAIRKVAGGGTYFTYDRAAQLEILSIRQKEIINLIASGKSQKQIATELGITSSAVDKQKNKIMEILNVSGPNGLFAKIFEKGLQFLRGPDINYKPKK